MNAVLAAAVLLAAVRMDLSCRRIKNELILAGLAAGTALRILFGGPGYGPDLLAGIFLPVIICWIPFLMHALGAGDIKLFSVIGCLYGGRDVIYCIGFSFLTAAGFSLLMLLHQRQLRTSLVQCFRYFHQIILKRQIIPYPGRDKPDHLIHFSAAILCGYAGFMGVKYCGIMPL